MIRVLRQFVKSFTEPCLQSLHSCNDIFAEMENVNPKIVHGASKRTFTIVVEGNIGSGKSTFLESFSSLPDITIMPEPVNRWKHLGGKHNLLELIYKDPLRWNMAFQSYVQLTRLQMHSKEVSTTFKLMERSLYSARYCFVQNYINTNMMTECERAICDEWWEFITSTQNVGVDLIVYLRTNPEVALERIRSRNRQEEFGIPLEYLQALHTLHDDWLRGTSAFKLPAPVVRFTVGCRLAFPLPQRAIDLASGKWRARCKSKGCRKENRELDANRSPIDVKNAFESYVLTNMAQMKHLVNNHSSQSSASSVRAAN